MKLLLVRKLKFIRLSTVGIIHGYFEVKLIIKIITIFITYPYLYAITVFLRYDDLLISTISFNIYNTTVLDKRMSHVYQEKTENVPEICLSLENACKRF